MNRVLLVLVVIAGGWIGYTQWPKKAESPMPAPSAPSPPGGDTLTAKRVEIVDDANKVMMVITSEKGVPVAYVSSKGKSLKIDLEWLAKKVQ
jgi:hypothetical protein